MEQDEYGPMMQDATWSYRLARDMWCGKVFTKLLPCLIISIVMIDHDRLHQAYFQQSSVSLYANKTRNDPTCFKRESAGHFLLYRALVLDRGRVSHQLSVAPYPVTLQVLFLRKDEALSPQPSLASPCCI